MLQSEQTFFSSPNPDLYNARPVELELEDGIVALGYGTFVLNEGQLSRIEECLRSLERLQLAGANVHTLAQVKQALYSARDLQCEEYYSHAIERASSVVVNFWKQRWK